MYVHHSYFDDMKTSKRHIWRRAPSPFPTAFPTSRSSLTFLLAENDFSLPTTAFGPMVSETLPPAVQSTVQRRSLISEELFGSL